MVTEATFCEPSACQVITIVCMHSARELSKVHLLTVMPVGVMNCFDWLRHKPCLLIELKIFSLA